MDPNIDQETGSSTSGRSPRFVQWAAFFVFSVVTLGSSVQVQKASFPKTTSNTYLVVCSVLTFGLTAIVIGAHAFPVSASLFVGTKIEGVLIIVLVALWTAIVSVNTAAGDGLAPSGEGSDAVQNANLYYFSWAGFITAIILLVSFLRDAFGLDVAGQIRSGSARLQYWAALTAASLIVLGGSVQVKKSDCSAFSDFVSDSYCRKTKFGVAAGTLTFVFCVLVISTKVFNFTPTTAASPQMLELIIAIYLAIQNAFTVAYITSADAPGSAPGNLYYFAWALFLLSSILGFETFNENDGSGDAGRSGGETTEDYDGDIVVETFDDAI